MGDTSKADYDEYVIACSDTGFTVDYDKDEKYYRAYNSDGYYLSLSYEGNNIMLVSINEPDEEVSSAEVTTEAEESSTVESTELKEAAEPTEAADDSSIKVEETEEVDVTESTLTVDNCPELAAMLSNKATNDESYSDFADKYKGQKVEFDGRIDYCTNHGDYTTRFDYLVSAGDYDPDTMIGPYFKFEDVNYSQLNTDLDTVSVGLNVHIVAEVVSFDSNSELFYLKPVSVTGR